MHPRSPGAIVALLFALSSLALGQFPQPEHPVAVTEGQEPVTLSSGEFTTGAAIDGAADVDAYSFFHTQGEILRIIVRKLDASTGADPRIRILENATASFLPAYDQFCSGNHPSSGGPITCTLEVGFGGGMTPPATGWYTLLVSDAGSNEPVPGQSPQPYRLRIEREPGLTPPEMGYGVTVIDDVAPVTDIDTITFPVVAGSLFDLTVAQFTGSLDPHVRVLDPGGAVVADQVCSGNHPSSGGPIACSFTIPFAPAVGGDYTLMIWDENHDETGTFQVTLQCLFAPGGSCPATPQPLSLVFSQPQGAGDLLIENADGLPGAPYVTALSFDPANAGPATGWWGGLHISLPDLLFQLNLGAAPFVGTLDGGGGSAWAFGALPTGLSGLTLHGVTMTFDVLQSTVTETSGRASLLLL